MCLAMAGVTALWASAADAADRARGKHATARTSAASRTDKVKPAPGPILAVVSLARQRISVYGSNGLIAHSGVSTGTRGHPTPTGVFSVVQKSRYHRSNIYSAAPMPYMQRITWSGVALHAGVLPGYPASHGCIRMSYPFAQELWGMTRIGARVVVAPDDPVAIEVAHPALPVPIMTPAPQETAEPPGDEPVKAEPVALTSKPAETAAPRLLNPMERARLARTETKAAAVATAKAAKAAVAASAARAAEASRTIADLRHAQLAAEAAATKLEAAKAAVEAAKTPEAAEQARAAQAAAESKAEEAHRALAEVAEREAVKTPEAFAAAKVAWEAERASEAAAAAQKAAELGVEPVSVFISKKAGRLYVRQRWAPIYEAPVTFKDPDVMVGTHLYLAVGPAEDGRTLRWLSVYTPPTAPVPHGAKRARDRDQPAPAVSLPNWSKEMASSAVLDRVEMSEEANRFVSERLWTGAALIISDQGISNETGATTDFIVLTR